MTEGFTETFCVDFLDFVMLMKRKRLEARNKNVCLDEEWIQEDQFSIKYLLRLGQTRKQKLFSFKSNVSPYFHQHRALMLGKTDSPK
jgi:hypothetical protein